MHKEPPRNREGRKDLVEYAVQDNIDCLVYWWDMPEGGFPGLSVYAYDQEILRMDCFGEGHSRFESGHCHINLRLTPQPGGIVWAYRPGTVRDNIEQAVYDLRHNLNPCLKTNTDERVRETHIDPEKLEPIARQVKAKLLSYMNKLRLE